MESYKYPVPCYILIHVEKAKSDEKQISHTSATQTQNDQDDRMRQKHK